MNATRELLRQLASGDEQRLRAALATDGSGTHALSRETQALVQLSALIALGAEPASLRWAADLAYAAGADDLTLVQVLLTSAPLAGAAQLVASAPKLALALGVDIETGARAPAVAARPGVTAPRARLRSLARPPRSERRHPACGIPRGPAS